MEKEQRVEFIKIVKRGIPQSDKKQCLLIKETENEKIVDENQVNEEQIFKKIEDFKEKTNLFSVPEIPLKKSGKKDKKNSQKNSKLSLPIIKDSKIDELNLKIYQKNLEHVGVSNNLKKFPLLKIDNSKFKQETIHFKVAKDRDFFKPRNQ